MTTTRAKRGRTAARGIAILGLLLVACPPRVPPPDLSLDPAELLGQVRSARERTRSVRGEARLRLRGEGGSGSVQAWIAAERPDRVYVETLDFFGNTAAVLAAADGELSYYDAREKVVYRGAATEANLRQLVPLPLPPAALAEILCGTPPLLDGRPVRAEPGPGWVALELADGVRVQGLRVGAGAAVVRSVLRVGGEEGPGTYDLEFGRFQGTSPARFPAEVTLTSRSPAVRMDLSWGDVETNAPIDPALFRPPVPRGARVVQLGDAPPPAALVPGESSR